MRRIVAVAFATAVLLAGALVLPPPNAQTQAPVEPVAAPRLDASPYTLWDLVEGDAPLELLPPDTLPAAPAGVTAEGIPAPEGYSVDFRHYPSPEEINDFLGELETGYPDLIELYDIGTSWQGRPIRAARVTTEKAAGDPADRPAMYIDGQHHARELISNQVALYSLWSLTHFCGRDPLATYLLNTRALYVVPSVNPDGNHIALTDYQGMRRTANPSCCDDDLGDAGAPEPDGRFDEDYSVGFGYGTDELFRYHFDQEWADLYPDNPFRSGWTEHQVEDPESLGRFTGALGGQRQPIPRGDMDGDGRQDEDEIGGVDANRNYDAHWVSGNPSSWEDTYRGPAVWSEPETRAVRDFVTARPHLAVALSYHSGVDVLLHPWGWSAEAALPDAEMFELLSAKGSQLTEANGFPGSRHTWTGRGLYPGSGSTMDYLYEQRGIFAWSPEVYGSSMLSRIERLGTTGTFSVGQSIGVAFNPPPDAILASTDRWHRWALYLLAATPNVELNAISVEGSSLVAVLGNDGILPVDVTLSLDAAGGGRLGGDAAATQRLQGHRARWTFPLAAVARTDNHLTVTATLPVGTLPHEVETGEWVFTISKDGVRLEEGVAVPFVPLGEWVGGWWSDPRWANYRPPRDEAIPATPPVTPSAVFLPHLAHR